MADLTDEREVLMRRAVLKSFVSVVSLAIASQATAGYAATDNGKPAEPGADIVVTASASNKTAQNASITVSQLSNAAITNFSPRSQAEVLRAIPGLNVQDTAGPGGNANIGVRGIPVSTGGSEYVGLQEDGLPVVLFGDMNFGNNDYWIRFDNSVDRVEAVKGGSASTFSSQAPGAVINYVSKTGTKEGGEIGVSQGLSYRETRIDFDYGAHLSDSVRFHIGGYVVDGDGPTHLAYTAEKGYQIKANITKDFSDGNGYIRLNFKRMDDQEPTFTSMPSIANISGSAITGYSVLGNIDARKYGSTGIYNHSFQILNAAGNLQTVEMQGIHPVVTSVGGEFKRDLGAGITVTDKFRWTDIHGSFSNQWTGEKSTSSLVGSLIGDLNSTILRNSAGAITGYNGSAASASQVIAVLRYGAGPNAGQVYTGNFVSNGAQAYTTFNDVGSLANDLTLSGKFDAGSMAHINARAGWFHMRQTINMDWRLNNVTQTLDGNGNPVPLDLFNAAGAQLTANGLTGFNNQWGGCCGGRHYDVNYTDDAPYGELEADIGRLNLDASIRYDSMKASGEAYAPGYAGYMTATDGLGSASVPTFNSAATPSEVIGYTKGYSSWSFGALYHVTDHVNVFARVSSGGRFNADRLLYNDNNFNKDGSLTAGGDHLSVNRVTQQEFGVKAIGGLGGARVHGELTFYRAQVKESNYDFTAPSRGQDPFIDTIYHSWGVEASGGVRYGNFNVDGYVVYTDVKDVVHTAHMVEAMPKWTYLFSPSYDMGLAAVGLSINGQSSSYISGNIKAPGSTFVNGFVKIRPMHNLELGVNANNLFNTLGYRANNGSLAVTGPVPGLAAGQAIIDNSAVLGRTVTASVKYRF